MTDQAALIDQLIHQTHQGAVFGEGRAFGMLKADATQGLARDAQAIARSLAKRLTLCLERALPGVSQAEIHSTVQEVVPKTAVFVPALTAGELAGERNQERLTLAAVAVGCMYVADQLTDRGDEAMLKAIEAWPGHAALNPRRAVLEEMQHAIQELARPEDVAAVLECFDQKVLANEARLHRLSSAFKMGSLIEREAFLDTHAERLAELMTEDAGFQSVTSSLYSIYRQNDPTLPPVVEIHANPFMQELLQVCNAAARIADEYGDWWMDAGNDVKYGVFSINPFNQYHPAMVGRFCQLAGIETARVAEIQVAFRDFHTNEAERKTNGAFITEVFFDQMRRQVHAYYQATHPPYDKYIELCMRVGEISYVNMMGDIQLARAAR